MEASLYSFIWKYSKREQLMLLALTVVTFPFLYATLELPKRIINDAIGSQLSVIPVFGVSLTQIQFLLVLSSAYLIAVLIHGLMKMRLNTLKGVVSERLLRRLRYTLLERMHRFPRAYFRKTSQGELVSMITSEAEPMGGLMGDAVAQPVFQAGQMLIILVFLFMQSVWFGLAGVALIPLQAYLIPMLQRQINELNKKRIKEIRAFSAEIGESAAGISDLRVNGGLRYRLAQFTDRLGRLFEIRFRIFQKKFFMKFLNNFITQLTPFFFYSVGGVLAIRGDITVGALVAALAAYKDLSAPWRELLTYYNQVQDMSLRWEIVTERFDPKGILDESLFEGEPETIPHLRGDIVLEHATVRTAEGNPVLEDINLTIPAGQTVGIKVESQNERVALAELLTREILPWRGRVQIGEHDLNDLHQAVIAARIGHAHSRPYIFDGTLGSNVMMPLMTSPRTVPWDPKATDRRAIEARRSGNSPDSISADWVDPGLAGLDDPDQIRGWWFELVTAMGIDEFMYRRMLNSHMDPDRHPVLAEKVVALRDEVARKLRRTGLDEVVYRFDPDEFNPALPLADNLLFAVPRREIPQEEIASEPSILALIAENDLTEKAMAMSQTIMDTLHQTFGTDGTQHPLFTALGIEEELYERLVGIANRRREKGDAALDEHEFALLMTVPFALTAERIGPAFPESFRQEILEIRKAKAKAMDARAGELFAPIEPQTYFGRLTLLENAIYGRISRIAGAKAEAVEDVVAELFAERGMRRLVAEVIFDVQTGIGGSNLASIFHERAAFSRAGIKRPDILICDRALASHDPGARRATRRRLRELLPNSTLIFMEENLDGSDGFDLFVELKNGRIDGVLSQPQDLMEGQGGSDLRRKLRAISSAELFRTLDSRNQRLLAFAAQWYEAKPGQRVFSMGDQPDAAYLCVSGQARLSYTADSGEDFSVSVVEPGRLIGDLAIILNEPRQLHLTAIGDVTFLRISAEEFRSVIEHDRGVLLQLLQTVAGHLTEVAELLRQTRVAIPQDAESPVQPPE